MFDVDQVNGRLRADKRIKTDSADDLSGLSWRYSVAQCELSKDVQMVPKQYVPVMPARGGNVCFRKNRTFLTGRDYDRNAAKQDITGQTANDSGLSNPVVYILMFRMAKNLRSIVVI